MDIVSRLKFFLEKSGVGNSQFADTCEIPRPTLSQLLNGRNKKVSDEIIAKIHRSYPQISIMWLMFGEGPMFKNSGQNAPGNSQGSDSLFGGQDQNLGNGLFQNSDLGSDLFAAEAEMGENGYDQQQAAPSSSAPSLSQTMAAIAGTVTRNAQQAARKGPGKRVVSIMVFYDDNSFDSFVPAQ